MKYRSTLLVALLMGVLASLAVQQTRAAALVKADAAVTSVASAPIVRSGDSDQTMTLRVTAASAAASGNLELWYTFGDGGGTGSSAQYALSYTTGQGTVGKGESGALALERGFWQPFSTSCCQGVRGNLSLSGIVDITDLCILVSYLIGGTTVLACYEEGNITASGIVDLADLSAFVSYLTGGDYVIPYCP